MSRLVQYGRRAKRPHNDDPEPTPKRQKIDPDTDTDDDDDLVPTRPSSPVASPARPKPKDLSQIFAPLPQLPVSPARSPGKSIAKRMLVRSRTEPTLPASVSPKSTLAPAASLPLVAAAPEYDEEPRSSPPSPSRAVAKPGVRTYSQSRSFLVALPPSTSRALLDPNNIVDPDEDVRESYSDLRTRWGVDNSEDDPAHVPGVTNEIMSMTELRSKGESRRFLDEVGYLLGGLKEEGMSTSVKRSSAVEIVVKMCDAEFARKARAADFIGRAWDAMTLAGAGADEGDKILDPCLALFVAFVARNRRDADELARRDGFLPIMTRLLQTPTDKDGLLPLDDLVSRKMGYSKPERLALTNLRNLISTKSELFTPTTIPSTRLLASYTLAAISPSFLPPSFLSPLLQTLLAELTLLHAPSSSPDLAHTEHCLRILDGFLLGAWGEGSGAIKVERDALGRGLIALCARAAKEEQDVQIARECIESSFRVLINLSHASPEWCTFLLHDSATLPTIIPQIFPPPPAVKREDDDDNGKNAASALDRQCLALGLLTNMVFATPEARDRIRDLQLPTCPHASHCTSALECLARLFAHMAAAPKPEPDTTSDLDFFRSHLAALLCLLTADSPRSRHLVRGALSVRALAGSLEAFFEFYRGLGEQGAGEAEAEADGDAMASRVGTALRELEGVS